MYCMYCIYISMYCTYFSTEYDKALLLKKQMDNESPIFNREHYKFVSRCLQVSNLFETNKVVRY